MNDQKAYCLAFLREHAETIERIVRERGGSNVRIYGSFAQGIATDKSDLDILIDPPADGGLNTVLRLASELHDALLRDVDVVRSDKIYEPLRLRILDEARSFARLLSGDFAPCRPKDMRLHLWIVLARLRDITGFERREIDDLMLHAIQNRLAKARERLAMIPAEFRVARPDVPWAELDSIVADVPDNFCDDMPADKAQMALDQAAHVRAMLSAALPLDEEMLGGKIAAAKPL